MNLNAGGDLKLSRMHKKQAGEVMNTARYVRPSIDAPVGPGRW
jgi:hypothetical protein